VNDIQKQLETNVGVGVGVCVGVGVWVKQVNNSKSSQEELKSTILTITSWAPAKIGGR